MASEWPDLDSIRESFRTLWNSGRRPSLQGFLRQFHDHPAVAEIVVVVTRIHLSRRLRAGDEAPLVEEVLDCLQAGAFEIDDALRLDLARLEYDGRWERGETETTRRAEYQRRFPEFAEQIGGWKPRWTCPRCRREAIPLPDETTLTVICPNWKCARTYAVAGLFRSMDFSRAGFDLREYAFDDELGQGGMGQVYRCRDPILGRSLAAKVIHTKLRRNPDAERRFINEAQVLGKLQHPGIVPIHNLGRLPDGRMFFTMKLVEGHTLAELLKRRAGTNQELGRFLGIFQQICHTIAYAHEHRVVHRDLKPANVMVGPHGEVQVMDWGLAKELAEVDVETAPKSRAEHEEVDGAGDALGTLAYMPPEQCRGVADQRSDVFGLGAILCEILTGAPPYRGSDAKEVVELVRMGSIRDALQRLYENVASPTDEPKTVDSELARLCEQCLQPNPADRPADAGMVGKAIELYLANVQERYQAERVAREREQVQSAEADRRHRMTEEYMMFLADELLSQADPATEFNRNLTLREALDRATSKLDSSFQQSPEINARLRISLGKIYFNLGEYLQSRELFAEANRIAAAHLSEGHPIALNALDQLGQNHIFLEEWDSAEAVLKRAWEIQAAVLGPEHEDTIHSWAKLGDLYRKSGRLDEAEQITIQVLETRRRLWGDDHKFVLVSLNGLAFIYGEMGQPSKALPLISQAEEAAIRTLGRNDRYTLGFRYTRARTLQCLKEFAAARELYEDVLDARRKILGERHFLTLQTEHGLAEVLLAQGMHGEAQSRLESIADRLSPDHGANRSLTGMVLSTLGNCLIKQNLRSEGERALQRSLELLKNVPGTAERYYQDSSRALVKSDEH